jgi:cytochrome c peroxidase
MSRSLSKPVAIVALTTAVVLQAIAIAQSTHPAATQPATQRSRRPPRPMLTDEQYKQLAADLRQKYLKPSDQWPAPMLDPGVAHREIGPLPTVEFPADNPYTKEKAELGKLLFFDPRLSGSGQLACASCHDPDLGWADGRTVAFGHDRQALKRNSPTLLNAAHNTSFFWDGRAASLEEQALMPIMAENEMHAMPQVVVDRIAAVPEYRKLFKEVFGEDQITLEHIARALATFQRTITSNGHSRFDLFLRGKNRNALSDDAIRGLHLFRTDARCMNCHNGPNFTDNQFHNLGLSYYGKPLEDLGRYHITKRPEDVGKFKTPTLRNVTRTRPYMHNGIFDLEGVLNMYNAGMPTLRRKDERAGDPLFPTKSHLLRELGLNRQDLKDLEAFLESLEERSRVRAPELPGMNR